MESIVGNEFVSGLDHKSVVGLAGTITPQTKVVGLYFSAHWCPPCRQFTPILVDAYKSDLKKLGMEIIFVSSDKDEEAFKGYHGEMPWYALPFSLRKEKESLSSKYKVQGIPTLVLLNAQTGETITMDGRAKIMQDPKGSQFPWLPKPTSEVLSAENKAVFFSKKSSTEKMTFTQATEQADNVLLYFSAHWCGPCRRFTPKLAKLTTELNAQGKNVVTVFVSADRDEASFKEYFADMPQDWVTIDFSLDVVREVWGQHFKIEGYPTLIVLDNHGEIINGDAVGIAMEDLEGKQFPWVPKVMAILNDNTAGAIGPDPFLMAFAADDLEAEEIQAAMNQTIEFWRGKAPQPICHGDVCGLPPKPKLGEERLPGAEDLLFFVAGSHPVSKRIRELIGNQQGHGVAVLDLNVPHFSWKPAPGGGAELKNPMFYRGLVEGWKNGKLPMHPVVASKQ